MISFGSSAPVKLIFVGIILSLGSVYFLLHLMFFFGEDVLIDCEYCLFKQGHRDILSSFIYLAKIHSNIGSIEVSHNPLQSNGV